MRYAGDAVRRRLTSSEGARFARRDTSRGKASLWTAVEPVFLFFVGRGTVEELCVRRMGAESPSFFRILFPFCTPFAASIRLVTFPSIFASFLTTRAVASIRGGETTVAESDFRCSGFRRGTIAFAWTFGVFTIEEALPCTLSKKDDIGNEGKEGDEGEGRRGRS